GDGDVAVREVGPFLGLEDVERVLEVLEVVQRLAHSHEDQVGQGTGQGQALVAGDLAVDDVHLGDDLGGGQVPQQSQRAGHAELAGHRAAHLGGDAERLPVGGGHVDALDQPAVAGP